MGGILKFGKEAVEWAVAIWHVLGWLGLTAIITGLAASIGGTVWAVLTGIPIPIAIMAGYCTLTGAVYLAMAPMAYRAISMRPPDAGAPPKVAPDYKAWRQVEFLRLGQAAALWCGHDPHSRQKSNDVQTRLTILFDAVRRGQLDVLDGDPSLPEDWHMTSRTVLKELAKRRGDDPEFLKD